MATHLLRTSDDRKSERFFASRAVSVSVEGSSLSWELHDLSAGGFGTVGPSDVVVGVTHHFTFTTPGSAASVTLPATAVHTYDVVAWGKVSYVTGWQFVDWSSDRTEALIDALFSMATDVTS